MEQYFGENTPKLGLMEYRQLSHGEGHVQQQVSIPYDKTRKSKQRLKRVPKRQ